MESSAAARQEDLKGIYRTFRIGLKIPDVEQSGYSAEWSTESGHICGATKLNCGIVPLPQKFRKPVRTREFNVGSNGIFFFFAPSFDAVELRSSPRLLATAQNTMASDCQVLLRGLWAMADALCAESWCTVRSTSLRRSCSWRADMPPHCCRGTGPAALVLQNT